MECLELVGVRNWLVYFEDAPCVQGCNIEFSSPWLLASSLMSMISHYEDPVIT